MDAGAYLADPKSPGFDEFRAHFLRCDDCAEVVASWTALEESLLELSEGRPAHPEPGDLGLFARNPNALDSETRARIDAHLSDCSPCGDEVAAVRAFPLDRLVETAEEPSVSGPVARSIRSLGARLFGGRDAERGGVSIFAAPDLALAFQSDEPLGDEQHDLVGMLGVVAGPYAGAVYPLRAGQTRLGRSPACDICLTDIDLERVELTIEVSSDAIELRSEHARRLVRVNEEPCESAVLADGDEIAIAGHRLQLRLIRGAH